VNTDSFAYGGSGIGNLGAVEAVARPWHSQAASAELTVPPLAVLWLAPDDEVPPGPPAAPGHR
jgi:1,4-alpha-glucan branching enzyme